MRDAAPDGGVDVALDVVGGQALRDALALVPGRDRIGTLVEHSVADELGVLGIRAQRSAEQLRELAAAYRAGALNVTTRSTYSLEQIADAHREVETGMAGAKWSSRPVPRVRQRRKGVRTAPDVCPGPDA